MSVTLDRFLPGLAASPCPLCPNLGTAQRGGACGDAFVGGYHLPAGLAEDEVATLRQELSVRHRVSTAVKVAGGVEGRLPHACAQHAEVAGGPWGKPVVHGLEVGGRLVVPFALGCARYGAPPAPEPPAPHGGLVFDGELTDRRVRPDAPPQAEALEAALAAWAGGSPRVCLRLPCGFGKTVVACAAIAASPGPALVLVHTDDLMGQWADRIATFLPGARVGRVQGALRETEDVDIVLATVQTLGPRPLGPSVPFGLLVCDEAHHLAAPTFSKVFWGISAARALGLSARYARKDGAERVVHWHLGPIVFSAERVWQAASYRVVRYEGGEQREHFIRGGRGRGRGGRPPLNHGRMATELAQDAGRTRCIAEELVAELRRAQADGRPRKALVLTNRKKAPAPHVDELVQAILLAYGRGEGEVRPLLAGGAAFGLFPQGGADDAPLLSVGRYTGSESREVRTQVEACDVLVGVYAIASEGLDIPRLDTLVLAMPVTDVLQAVGRILRAHPDKNVPLVIDVHDPWSAFNVQGFQRFRAYREMGLARRSGTLCGGDMGERS
jgi:hypothetical protein